MKTLRDLEAFIEATGKPVLAQCRAGGLWSVQTLLMPKLEFTGESLEKCCERMADYVEQMQLVKRGPTQ